MFSTKMFLLLRRMQIRLQKSEFFRVNNEKHSQFFGILNFFTKIVPLYLEAEKFRRPAKIHSISFQKRISFLKPLNDFLIFFPWKRKMQIEIPTRKVFPQNGEEHEYTKFLRKITLSAEFFSLIRSTVVMKSKYKMVFRNVSKGSKYFKISIEVCCKSSFWQLRIW